MANLLKEYLLINRLATIFCFLILLTIYSPWRSYAQNELEFNEINITLEETKNFPGRMSLAPVEAYIALKYCTYHKKIKILEFGAGESTVQFSKILTKKNIPFEYHVFENDTSFLKKIEHVQFHYYELPNVTNEHFDDWIACVARYELPELPIFDLIIVDGPHGVARAQWYQKFKKYTKPGTIILIDDFHHFTEFSQALDKHFTYDSIIEYNQNPRWKIINSGIAPISNFVINKTFKIVKIK